MHRRIRTRFHPASALIFASLSCSWLIAAERVPLGDDKTRLAPDALEMFSAVDAGLINVKFIPTDAAKANIVIQNNTNGVLHIELPEAFAAVPILAQFGQDAFGGQGQQGGGGATQGVGGGPGGGNGNGFGNNFQGGNGRQGGAGQGPGMGLGFMRIAPKKSRKVKATTVCLEYGKPEPNPRIKYQMIPIEQFTDDARVAQLCKKLGRGEVAQNTAQAAAWHFASELSWERLADINRVESRYLGNIKFFQATELESAKALVESIQKKPPATSLNLAEESLR